MIEIKDAAEAAEAFARELYDGDVVGIRIEEVELSEEEDVWQITLGWVEPEFVRSPAQRLSVGMSGLANAPRVYKRFLVDRESGEVLAMKIREI